MTPTPRTASALHCAAASLLLGSALLAACTAPGGGTRSDLAAAPVPPTTPAPAPVSRAAVTDVAATAGTGALAGATTPVRRSAAAATAVPAASTPAPRPQDLVAPAPLRFEDAVARAGGQLIAQAGALLGNEARVVVIDPLIDANTGAQTVSTARMGEQLATLVKAGRANWQVQALTRQTLAQQPLLLIGTLTPVNINRSIDAVPDAFRVWLSLIDLRTGRVVAKQLDRATTDSVNPEPLKFYADSPTWHKDRTVLGYVNSCQVNTAIGDPADPDYLARLPAAALVNEAIMAYGAGRLPAAQQLYQEAAVLADPGDLRVLNGLYLTNWQLGKHDAARDAFERLVASGLDLKRLPVKLLFKPGGTAFNAVGDLPQQYQVWIKALAQELGKARACVRVVGHTSRTGSARTNELLSRQRAESVMGQLARDNRSLGTRLSASGVGSREALVGLGTDDLRDALDRRVEFRVVDCV